jgi:hypothetical protein
LKQLQASLLMAYAAQEAASGSCLVLLLVSRYLLRVWTGGSLLLQELVWGWGFWVEAPWLQGACLQAHGEHNSFDTDELRVTHKKMFGWCCITQNRSVL